MKDADRELVRKMIERARRQLTAEFELALRAYTATLRAELAQEVGDIDDRITNVHERAIRALTHLIERRTPA